MARYQYSARDPKERFYDIRIDVKVHGKDDDGEYFNDTLTVHGLEYRVYNREPDLMGSDFDDVMERFNEDVDEEVRKVYDGEYLDHWDVVKIISY